MPGPVNVSAVVLVGAILLGYVQSGNLPLLKQLNDSYK